MLVLTYTHTYTHIHTERDRDRETERDRDRDRYKYTTKLYFKDSTYIDKANMVKIKKEGDVHVTELIEVLSSSSVSNFI